MKKKHDISKKEIKGLLSDKTGKAPSELEVQQTEEALLQFAKAHAAAPRPALREKILGKLNGLNKQSKTRRKLDPGQLPMLDASANWLDWQAAVAGIEPPDDYDGIHLHPLESNEQRELFVAWVKEYVDEEVHYDILESFLLLEGSCECHITDEKGSTRVVQLWAGDFIEMQLGETHDIVITSPQPGKAILQWKKLVA